MTNLVVVEANALLAASSGQAAYTAPTTPIKIDLLTATGSASAAGTSATGGGATKQTATFAAPSAESIATNAALTWTNVNAQTFTGLDEWDSAGSPIRRWWGALTTPKTANAGDTFTIASGSYTKTLG